MTISAKVICDSVSQAGIRITTMELEYPRFIHAEFMTHRVFSRNAASSRAIPVKKMIERVKNDPAMPIHWGKNQPGMQAREELTDDEIFHAKQVWVNAAKYAADTAEYLSGIGLHKQVVNRLLEPFQHIKVIVTATEWDNFFKLRLHPDAQPEIQELAKRMKEVMDWSTPTLLYYGQWHLPYVGEAEQYLHEGVKTKCSVARCARVSYLNHDQSIPDIEKDIVLHDKLLEAGHMSPFEHVATPMSRPFSNDGWSGNFYGWTQYRQSFLYE